MSKFPGFMTASLMVLLVAACGRGEAAKEKDPGEAQARDSAGPELPPTINMLIRGDLAAGASHAFGGGDPRVQNIYQDPAGPYAKIDVRRSEVAITALASKSADERRATTSAIQANPENYAPPVFYALSRVLFYFEEKKDEAAFWLYAGQLRARFDAYRCAESSARQAVAVLDYSFAESINEYVVQDIPKLERLLDSVVAWDRKTPHRYDHRWINLHGMGAYAAASDPGSPSETAELSVPESQWKALAETNRARYLKGFKEAIRELEAQGE
jgi:hypothetical protein